jgi:hypothetical protein
MKVLVIGLLLRSKKSRASRSMGDAIHRQCRAVIERY